ncbi:putative WRKY transcription factor 35 [Zea mays]|uniref:Putative WRKY transcription factor 35 n=1 Tax=Zea mays TaxID=4577 RepID=A0A3L6F7Y2_MAIZE|nr:putative WRKY transcription factor 35 [Zea mays]
MCDYFLQRMEDDRHHHHQAGGDLTDVVRAGGAMHQAAVAELSSTAATGWQLPAEPAGPPGLFPPARPSSSSDGAGPSGGAYAGLSGPFASEFRADSAGVGPSPADFFDFGGGGGMVEGGPPQMPALSPREVRPYPVMMGGDTVKIGVPAMMPGGLPVGPPCAFDAIAGMQMPSPHCGGIKRRKNQARKVVCIPAPAASAGGRTTGEVVPSDLWAWRKYGQKPIKGSPYPRGYYRCSSSKGCPARKQVERNRTDPSLLVITYNSEHNHPWPTQRNALAGSTRSHHAKSSKNKYSSHSLPQTPNLKAEPEHHLASGAVPSATTTATAATATSTTTTTSTTSNSTPPPPPTMAVKEEAIMVGSEMERVIDHHDASVWLDHSDLMQQMFSQSYYRPMIPEAAGGGLHADDFFADLAELESDPMSLIFPAGGEPGKENKSLDADPLFNMLDWGATNVAATSSFEQDESGW